jgi:hypothetical protein
MFGELGGDTGGSALSGQELSGAGQHDTSWSSCEGATGRGMLGGLAECEVRHSEGRTVRVPQNTIG